ncbi:MAG: hypothetical protein ACT4O4_09070 [Nitrospiraceae bacterium]
MKAGRRLSWITTGGVFAVVIGLGTVLQTGPGRSATCALSPHHGGDAFPVERVDPDWACRLQAVIDNHTTAGKVGPMRAALSQAMYQYLLDHPPFAAALINRLDLGLYKSEARGQGRFWGDDGEGTRGMVHLVDQDRRFRIYYLEGAHNSRLLPNITGKAVVFLKMDPVRDANGMEAMDSTLVSYTKLDNRILSGLVSLLRPLVGGIVTRKLQKGVETVNRLGQLMRQHPERVLFEAMDPPPLPSDDVAVLKEALGSMRSSGSVGQRKIPTP